MVALINIAVELLADAARFSTLLFRPTRLVQAENLFLRRQLALFKERGIQPRRVDSATRISLSILARFFEWRDALFVVRPNTMIRCVVRKNSITRIACLSYVAVVRKNGIRGWVDGSTVVRGMMGVLAFRNFAVGITIDRAPAP